VSQQLRWKIHVSDLFEEIVNKNDSNAIFRQPLTIFQHILAEIAKRATELEDDILLAHCLRLTLFETSDPNSERYNPEGVGKFIEEALGDAY